jgi:hypothetical protein
MVMDKAVSVSRVLMVRLFLFWVCPGKRFAVGKDPSDLIYRG